MREILFRGKRADNGEWIEGSLILTTSTMEKPFIVDSCWCYSDSVDDEGYAKFEYLNAYEVIPESVSEFTGLTDKNSVRIFEGDIISIPFEEDRYPWEENCVYHENGEVYFDNEHHGWYVRFSDNEALSMWEYDESEVVIIGNIHDNPELLGGDDNG